MLKFYSGAYIKMTVETFFFSETLLTDSQLLREGFNIFRNYEIAGRIRRQNDSSIE